MAQDSLDILYDIIILLYIYMAESLLNSSTGSPLHLIFITDKPSQSIIQQTIRNMILAILFCYKANKDKLPMNCSN